MSFELILKAVVTVGGAILGVWNMFKAWKAKKKEEREKKRKELNDEINNIDDEQSVTDLFDDLHRRL